MERKAEAVLDCAQRVFDAVNERTALSAQLIDEVHTHVQQSFPFTQGSALAHKVRTFDDLGTRIWNASIGLLRNDMLDNTGARIAQQAQHPALIRLFALQLIEASSRLQRPSGPYHCTKVLKAALKTAQTCLDRNCFDLALKALELCSEQVGDIMQKEPVVQISIANENASNQKDLGTELVAQYFLLRTFHAFKIDRLDLANHFFVKFESYRQQSSLRSRERAADLFYEIARSLVDRAKLETALTWFERAATILTDFMPETTSVEVAELSISVMISYVDGLLDFNADANRSKCREVLNQLDLRYRSGGRVAIDVARLKVLISEQPCDYEALQDTLIRISKLPALTDGNFKLIMQSMRRASQVARAATLSALRVFLNDRLLPEVQADVENQLSQAWLEKATIAFIMFATSASPELPSLAIELQDLLDTIQRHTVVPFSASATHAAQALIWKFAETCDNRSASSLHEIMRRPLFANAGHLNKGRIGRRAMARALGCDNVHQARQAFFELPVTVRNEPSTRYLAFRTALKANDQGLAEESIDLIVRSAGQDPTYLYACALDAQQSHMRPMAVIALQAILDRKPPGAHLSAVLRCTARLLIAELEASGQGVQGHTHAVLEVFEAADRSREHIRQAAPDLWLSEMQWWSKNTYNLALECCATMDPGSLVRLLAVCYNFLESWSIGMNLDPQQQDEIAYRKLNCSFLSVTALMVLGRTGTEQDCRESYAQARKHIDKFNLLYKRSAGSDDDVFSQKRAFQVLKFDVECVLKLEQWSEMRRALEACLNFEGVSRWDSLVDLLIITQEEIRTTVPGSEKAVLELLQRAISATWDKEKNLAKLAQWVRIAFTLGLDGERPQFSLLLAQQAADMAEGGYKEKHDRYPSAELHWLASTCFNRAVDFLGSHHKDDAVLWMDAALNIARWADDNRSLHALLTERRAVAQQRIEREQQGL